MAKTIELEKIKFKELAAAIKAINDSGVIENKIMTIGKTKEDLVKTFIDTIQSIPDGEDGSWTGPEAAGEYYNKIVSVDPPKKATEDAGETYVEETGEKDVTEDYGETDEIDSKTYVTEDKPKATSEKAEDAIKERGGEVIPKAPKAPKAPKEPKQPKQPKEQKYTRAKSCVDAFIANGYKPEGVPEAADLLYTAKTGKPLDSKKSKRSFRVVMQVITHSKEIGFDFNMVN
jgi:hypothetical protein